MTSHAKKALSIAIETAIGSGLARDEVLRAVVKAFEGRDTGVDRDRSRVELVYEIIPEGLTTVALFSKHHGVRLVAIRGWLNEGKLERRGFVKSGHSQSFAVLFDEAQASKLMTNNGTASLPGPDLVYDELPDGLMDLPTAAKKYGLNIQLVRSWIRGGKLECRGRFNPPGRPFSSAVISEPDLKGLAENYRESRNKREAKGYAEEPVHFELPEGLIDLPAACKNMASPQRRRTFGYSTASCPVWANSVA